MQLASSRLLSLFRGCFVLLLSWFLLPEAFTYHFVSRAILLMSSLILFVSSHKVLDLGWNPWCFKIAFLLPPAASIFYQWGIWRLAGWCLLPFSWLNGPNDNLNLLLYFLAVWIGSSMSWCLSAVCHPCRGGGSCLSHFVTHILSRSCQWPGSRGSDLCRAEVGTEPHLGQYNTGLH